MIKPPVHTPFADPRAARRPGLFPLNPAEWTEIGEDYAEQLALRDRLIREKRDVVFAGSPESLPARREALARIKTHVLEREGFSSESPNHVRRPDGAVVGLDSDDPLIVAGRLVQEDLCLMERRPEREEYVLTAAILCFPTRWSLAEKIGRPMTMIHTPVPEYDDDLAKRVNRVFEMLTPERPLWRANWSVQADPELHQPSGATRREAPTQGPFWLRVERQSFMRLPGTRAIVFGIRLHVSPLEALTPALAGSLRAAVAELTPDEIAYRGGEAFRRAVLKRLEDLTMRDQV